jgi:hypothetical protein
VTYTAIIHPWNYDIADVYLRTNPNNSWIRCDAKQCKRSRWFYLLHPLIYLALFGVVTYVKLHYHLTYWAALVMIAAAAWK